VVLVVQVPLESFPLDAPAAPFRPSGALDRPYPDIWDYAHRDYGNRIGLYRLVTIFQQTGVRPTAFVDADIVRRYPRAMGVIVSSGWEVAASSLDRGALHYGGIDVEEEHARIAEALSVVGAVARQGVTGWQSPGQSESYQTLAILASLGIRYVADWANDDRPYMISSEGRNIVAVPTSFELSDRNVQVHHDGTVRDYADQIERAMTTLLEEATPDDPRVLPLTLTPWVSGYPHRVKAVREMLSRLVSEPAVLTATCDELARMYVERSAEQEG
jgi:peptidoglycan/xylan/chitin deacetylase (PgdA/CDA1 family)